MIEQISSNSQWANFEQAPRSLPCKIGVVAISILKKIWKVASFPLRLLGSKTFSLPGVLLRLPIVAIKHLFGKNNPCSTFRGDLLCDKGYHWFKKTPITQEQAKSYMPLATAVGCVHRNNTQWMAPFGYSPIKADTFDIDLEKNEGIFFDRSTGLKIMALEKGVEVLLVFGALKTHESQFDNTQSPDCKKLTHWTIASCVGSLLGGCPALHTIADKTVKKLLNSDYLKNKKITLSGLSLGGSIASYVGLRQNIPTIAMNAFPLGPGLQKKIGHEKLQNADHIVTNIVTKGDLYSDWPWLAKFFDMSLNLLGIRTMGVFGKIISVPSIHKNFHNNHTDPYGALAAKWMPECKTLCLTRYSKDRHIAYESFKELASLVAAKFRALESPQRDVA